MYALIVFATCLPVLGLRLLMRRGQVALAAGLFLSWYCAYTVPDGLAAGAAG